MLPERHEHNGTGGNLLPVSCMKIIDMGRPKPNVFNPLNEYRTDFFRNGIRSLIRKSLLVFLRSPGLLSLTSASRSTILSLISAYCAIPHVTTPRTRHPRTKMSLEATQMRVKPSTHIEDSVHSSTSSVVHKLVKPCSSANYVAPNLTQVSRLSS